MHSIQEIPIFVRVTICSVVAFTGVLLIYNSRARKMRAVTGAVMLVAGVVVLIMMK